ncbi:plasmid mobilization protein [Streptomyces sp. NPDC055036]
MHDQQHEDPTHHERHENPTSPIAGASCRSGHSPAGGAPEPDPAPGVAGPVRGQGAPGGKAATEGGPQPGKAHRKRRTKAKGKGKARPRDKKQRPAQSVRLNDQEHALIQAGADAVGMSLAGFLAHSALAAARDQSRTAVAIATERNVLTELFAARRQLGWAGSNLNQVAKALNSGGDVPHLNKVITDIQRAANAVKKAADRVANPQTGEAA